MKPKIEMEGIKAYLVDQDVRRFVGILEHRTLTVIRDPKKHYFHKYNAYGINAEIINSDLIDAVVIEEPERRLIISTKNIHSFGRLWRDSQTGDQQYLVPLKEMSEI